MVKINGAFHYKSTEDNQSQSCAVFFIGEIDEILTLTVTSLSLSRNKEDEFIKVTWFLLNKIEKPISSSMTVGTSMAY